MPTLEEALQDGLLDGPTSTDLGVPQRFRVFWWGVQQSPKWEEMVRLREEGMTVRAAYQNAKELE